MDSLTIALKTLVISLFILTNGGYNLKRDRHKKEIVNILIKWVPHHYLLYTFSKKNNCVFISSNRKNGDNYKCR